MYWRTSERSHICARSSQYSKLVNEGFAGSVLALMKDSKLLEEYSSKALEKIQKYFDLNRLAGDVFEAYK